MGRARAKHPDEAFARHLRRHVGDRPLEGMDGLPRHQLLREAQVDDLSEPEDMIVEQQIGRWGSRQS